MIFLTSSVLFGQTWDVDNLSEYSTEKADLICEVKIRESFYMTDMLTFVCDVLSIKKGFYDDKVLTFDLSYPGKTKQIEGLRMDALNVGDTVLLYFRKHSYLEGIEIGNTNYGYMMAK